MFSPLDCATQSIRLIEILPGDDAQIQCKLHVHELNPTTTSNEDDGKKSIQEILPLEETNGTHTKLEAVGNKSSDTKASNVPKFTALCYTWGPPEPVSEITIDGEPFEVRMNLQSALSSIRKKIKNKKLAGRRLFWIDAICINQTNILERNHQVSMMKEIFSQADMVLVWLGSEQDDSSTALKFISTISLRLGNLGENRNDPGGPRSMTAVQQRIVDGIFKDLATQSLEEPILAVCSRAYWTRLLIVQEVVLARNVLVLCRGQFCNWKSLVYLLVLVEYKFRSEDIPADGIIMKLMESRAGEFFESWDSKKGSKRYKEGIGGLAQQWDRQKFEDPRDRVYGLLGLVDIVASFPLLADYSKSADDIWKDLVPLLELEYPRKNQVLKDFTFKTVRRALGCNI